MSEAEAATAGVDNRRSHFRVDNGKANLAPPPDKSSWYCFVSEHLGNGPDDSEGDSVGVVKTYTWPEHKKGVTALDLARVQTRLSNGNWRQDPQSGEWAGIPIASALDLDLALNSHKAKVVALIKMWVESGALIEREGKTPGRKKAWFIDVGTRVDLGVQTYD